MKLKPNTPSNYSPQISGYAIVEPLYSGSRTAVYRAVEETRQRSVVIKTLQNEYPNFRELVQFRNQYAITKNLNLEGIVRSIALERYGNRYALVMEDTGGTSLAEYKQRSPLSIPQLLNIALQLSEILHQLHNNSIIHKDIKPANILIRPETQQIELIDFSISSLLPKETQTIQTPNILEGTLSYLSPEQTGRMNRGIDYRSDFYSLGVTFYELLTGTLPFYSEDPLELLHCHMAEMPIPVISYQFSMVGEPMPQMLSDIVMKLMAKNAEERYQSALGLKYDLEKCLYQWKEKGTIEPFKLGERDICDRFIIPEKLYGRENEVKTLLEAFERVATGNSEIMLVAGFSGIGKTAVINEVHKPIVKQRGYFIKGKFDQFNRNIPFSAFVQAFRSLMGQILSESDAELADWKNKILEIVGENGQVLIEVIPELQHIIGEQPSVPELSGTAAQNRFNLLFQKFISVFTTKEHPLVLFLDDLQWADLASLNLMKVLMENTQIGYLLLLGAYRDNEVFPAHPLMLSLAELEKQNTTISTITLVPLSVDRINQLVAETLSCTLELAEPLTDLVYQKTKGNPFFTTQFLKGLYEDGLIIFERNVGYWECDLVKVRDAALTDDVVEFMAGRLYKLPEKTQNVLKLAACIGNQFDLETLAIICETPSEEVASALWSALQEGLVLPQSEAYKFFQEWEKGDGRADSIAVGYRFLHDRVQQAAYSLIRSSHKSATHYKLGRLLLEGIAEEEKDEKIFRIVNNLNRGIELIDDRLEKIEIARLNLTAARKAKKSIAYSASVDFLNIGIQLLGKQGWSDEYLLMFDLHKEGAESEYLQGNLEQSEVLANRALSHAKSAMEKAEIYTILIVQYTITGQYEKALDAGKTALNLLGIQWREDKLSQDLEHELEFAKKQLGDREIASLIDLPEMEIPEKRSAMAILNNLLPTTFSINPALWKVFVVKMVNLSLQHGNIAECCFGYSFYGVLISSMFEDYKLGYEFGILSLNLSRKFKDLAQESKSCNILAAFLLHWRKPIRHCESINNRGYEAGLESGQIQFIGYITYNRTLSLFHSGKYLKELQKEFPVYLPVLEKIKHYHSYDIMIGCQLVVSMLTSPKSQDLFEPIQEIKEREHLEICKKRNSLPGICSYQILKAQVLYLFDRPQSALKHLLSAKEFVDFIVGHFILVEYNYYHSLVLLAIYKSVSSQERAEILERVQENQKQLKIWAKNCPENFQHKVNLIEAEIAQNRQDKFDAIEYYDRAIAGAKENDFIQDEALANELFAKFYLDWGREKEASVYMQEAYYCYAQWGAKAKINDLEQRYPQLLKPIFQRAPQSGSLSSSSSTSISTITSHSQTATVASISSLLDFSSLLKASQTLSGEIELERLLSTLMEIILENAGATKGALLLTSDKGLTVDAIATRNNEDLQFNSVHQSIPLNDYPDLPSGLINYVKRTAQTALLDAKTAQTQFAGDTYFRRFSPQSLLCFPLLERGNLIGILYLENSLTADAFTRDRVELLDALCAQAAISLSNARLYQQAQQALKDLQNAQLQLVQNEKMATLGNLVAGVAHEINNPVGFIGGNISVSQEHLQDLLEIIALYQENASVPESILEEIEDLDLEFITEDFPKLIASMQTGCDRIHNISTSLRTFSRTDTDAKTEFNLHEGIESTLLILKYRLKANEQRPAIKIVKEYGDLPEVKCYAGQINQVFMNLVANAIDALDEFNQERSFEEIKEAPNQITIQTEVTSQSAIVRIGDNGKGMPEEVRAKIFEQGFTTKGVGKGTGLGLAIARQIIAEKHGGAIACHSKPGKGTTFVIEIPLRS